MTAQSKFKNCVEKSSHLFKCLADKNRLSIFAILIHGRYTVSEINHCLNLPQNLISHHLKILKLEGLAESQKVGRKIYYSLNKEKLKDFDILLGRVLQPTEARCQV